MARVEIASLPWGWVTDENGNGLSGETVTLTDLSSNPATTYSAVVGGASSTQPLTTASDGTVPGFIGEGTFNMTAVGVTRQVEAAAGGTVTVLTEAPLEAKLYGVKADGATDDTAAWDALIAGLADGAAVTWNGESVIQPGRQFTGRVALLGQGRRTAFKISGGTTTNDGIRLGGTDGPRYFHILRDVDIVGGASCCRRALVLLNLIDPEINVHVKAGATDYAVSIEGVQNAKLLKATVSNNSSLAYTGTAPVNGVRVVGSALLPTNANDFDLNVEALAGVGIFADGSVGAAGDYNNTLHGVSQGNGTNLDIRHWKNACLTDLHLEAGTVDAELVSCQGVHIGPRVFVDGNLNLVTCDRVTLDGFSIHNAGGTATLTIENDTTNTRLGDVDYDVLTDSAPSTIYPVGFRKIASKTWDPASIADGAQTSTTLTVTGALVGDVVAVGFTPAVPAGALLVGAVTAANTVTVTLLNKTGGVLDLASGTVKALVAR